MSASAFGLLTRHFIGAIAAPRLLTDLGVDFLRRTTASVIGILIVSGIFLTRALFKKYADLYASWNEVMYLRAVESDSLLMIALPMLVIAVAAVLLAPLLFPDETDYRVLTPLPVTRVTIFAAKLAATTIVVAVLALSINAIASLWFPVATGGRWMPYPLPVRVVAHAVATISGSMWAFAAVMAVQGLCLVAAPGPARARFALVVQAAVFVALLVAIPYVLRISSVDANDQAMLRPPLAWLPPAWFLGVERSLLESTTAGYGAAARRAAVASIVCVAVVMVCYLQLFRRAELLASDASSIHGRSAHRRRWPAVPGLLRRLIAVHQPTRGVLAFVGTVVMRSRLHQTVFLLIVGIGFAILIGKAQSVLDGATLSTTSPRAAIHAALSAPLLVGLAMTMGLRAVFLLPLDPRAVWVFRLTESPATRAQWLDAAALSFTLAATIPALLVAAVLQPYALGSRWLTAAVVTTVANLLLVEIVLHDWSRVPFTCSYLPGKRVLAFTLGVVLGTYFVYVYVGAHLVRWSLGHPSRLMVLGGLLLAAYAALRRSRQRAWGRRALEFEDEDPLAIRTLNLLPDERGN